MFRVSTLAVLTVLAACMVFAVPAQAALIDFHSAPTDWTGVGNVGALETDNLNFGHSATNNAGGASGEIGGIMSRQTSGAHYYGQHLATEQTWATAFSFSSDFYLDSLASISSDTAILGFFDRDQLATGNWATPSGLDYVGLRVDNNDLYMSHLDQNGGWSDTKILSAVADQTIRAMSFSYDPAVGTDGTLSMTIAGTTLTCALPAGTRTSGASFDTFGLWAPQYSGWTQGAGKCGVYVDNLTATGVTATYTPEPSSLVLTVLGAFGLLAYAWRRRK